jgi:Tfp pilus assembly protein PilO
VTQLDGILLEASEFQKLKSQLMSRYNALPSDMLARLNKLLPDHVDNVRLILDVDSLAAQDNLTLDNVIINTAADSSSAAVSQTAGAATALGAMGAQKLAYDSLTLQFKTSGTYQNLTQFLRSLQSSLRLVDVIGLSTQINATDSKTAKEPTYTYNIKVQTYWLK